MEGGRCDRSGHTAKDTATEEAELVSLCGEEVAAIVRECSDDKALVKWQRKKHQIDAAPHKSPKAKLVSLGDKLYNLRDLDASPPSSWSPDRTQLYFMWAAQVVSRLRGTNDALEVQLEKVFNKRGVSMLNPDPDTSCTVWQQYGE
jgi:guanosine-3',5'-bis(diphosphate) 3'-pyrophosphohydrolase